MYMVKCNGEQVVFKDDYNIYFSNEDYTPFSSEYDAQEHINLHLIVMSGWMGENNFERYVRESVFEIVEV